MPLDHTGLNANSPGTTGLASTESPLVPRKSHKPLGIDQSRANSPQTVVGPNSEEEHWNTSMSINVGPPASIHHDASPTSISLGSSASAPAVPSVSAPTAPSVSAPAGHGLSHSAPSSPSVRENNHHSNTPPSDNNNTDDQEQLNKAEDLTYLTSHQQPRRHLLLGRRPAPVTGPAETYDYTQIYEEDEPYTEMGPNARVWKVYNQEVIRIDSDRVEDWRDGLDSLLVFAALFSAVITTFVVQTSTSLQQDWGEVTANLLVELIAVQRAGLNGSSVNSIPPSQLTPSSKFTPRPLDVAINAFWFLSLALSLSTALGAIVCKQWIHQYTIMPSTGSLQERVQVHHFRFMGLEKWHVAGIIGLLPTFVHLSLGVFFLGLIIFLHDLSLIIGIIVDLMIFLTIGSYTVVNLLPIWFTDCPYKTPFTSHAFSAIWALYHVLGKSLHKETSLVAAEKSTTTGQGQDINLDILSWLITSSSNSSVKSIAMEALSNLPPCQMPVFKDKLPSDFKLDETLHHHTVQSTSGSESSYGRAIRSLVRVMKLDSFPYAYRNLFPLPDSSMPLIFKPQSDIIDPYWHDEKGSSWELVLNHIAQALENGEDGFRCESLLWCFYFDFLEATGGPTVFLHQQSEKLGKDIFWKMVQSVSSAISIDGLKRASSFRRLRWTQFMLDPPTNPNESQKFGFKEMTIPCTIWEFLRTFPAPFLVQHILPVFQESYDDLIPPSPLVKENLKSLLADIPEYLHLLHYAAVTPVAWTSHSGAPSTAISKLIELASAEGEQDQKKALEVLSINWTWILFSPDLVDDLIHNWDTMEDLLDRSFDTLHGSGKDPMELITKVAIHSIAAATRISDSSRAEELAWNCFRIMSQKLNSALTKHPQWISPLWKTLTEQKVLSLSVEPMGPATRYWLYEVQQKYLAGLAPPQNKSLSEGEEAFREEAIAYISGERMEPLTSLLKSTFFYDDNNPRQVLDLQESLHSLEWLAQLKNSENKHVNRIPKEKWLFCLEQVENELIELEIKDWWATTFKGAFEQNPKILRNFRAFIEHGHSTQGTTLRPSLQVSYSQSPRPQEPESKHSTFQIPSSLKRTWRRLKRTPDAPTRYDDLEAGRSRTPPIEMQLMLMQPQDGNDDNMMGQMEGGSGMGGLAADGQERLTIDGLPNENTPLAETIHDIPRLDEHIDKARPTHVNKLGRPDRDGTPPSTSLPKAHSTDQREIEGRKFS